MIKILPKYTLPILLSAAALSSSAKTYNNTPIYDTFEYVSDKRTEFIGHKVIPEGGSTEESLLKSAPSPNVTIAGKRHKAKIVVSIKNNLLYKYNDKGDAEKVYSIATGKPSTPTHAKVGIVTHIETYPYRMAPRHTKRRRNPSAYGAYCICMNKVDPKTGEQSSTGEFIHSTNNPSSVGTKASHGCMRLFKEDITELKSQVKRGDYILIIE